MEIDNLNNMDKLLGNWISEDRIQLHFYTSIYKIVEVDISYLENIFGKRTYIVKYFPKDNQIFLISTDGRKPIKIDITVFITEDILTIENIEFEEKEISVMDYPIIKVGKYIKKEE